MKRIVKQVVGIDVAQAELVVMFGRMHDDWLTELVSRKSFPNNKKGFDLLLKWAKKLSDSSVSIRYVMEATGVYHESLAYFLDEQQQQVSIILPNRIKNYFKTIEIKTVTDNTAAEAITRFGLERSLEDWKKPNPVYKKMRQLCRERDQLIAERTMVKNELHAENSEAEPNNRSINRIKKRIELLNKQEKEIKAEINDLVQSYKESKESTKLICTIPSVGILTAATVLSETNGFDLIKNKKQLASYAGLDVRDKQSGTSIKGKPRISKQGNRHLRKAMHLPALTAIRHDERFKAVFTRIVQKQGIKMKAAVAVQRKLLEMMYTVYKTGVPYDKDYLKVVVC